MPDSVHLLVVDDDPDLLALLAQSAQAHGYSVATASSLAETAAALDRGPLQVAVVAKAFEIVASSEGDALRAQLMGNVLSLRSQIEARGMGVYGDPSAIVAVKTGDEALARMTARELPDLGLISNLVEFPAVAKGQARFRLQVMARHTPEQLTAAADRMQKAMAIALRRLDAGFDRNEMPLALAG